ncbi:hypothetical protein [uncultured Cellulomonas sp.]|uniref:hypothetical protein n=1 Tax=uncultured Cellulomonas sp. TaxID=189682 RepID=UPI002623FC09|nr:hypothetical protein [uncultured Cellulomonas sp.]
MKRIWATWILSVSVALLVLAVWLYTRSSTVVTVDANAWEAVSAVGTVGATLVALGLALDAWHQRKDAVARLVSAWVTEEYTPRRDRRAYQRKVTLHVANEGDQPVFDAQVSVILGTHDTPVGPLTAPSPIAVVPPRRALTFDLSVALLAHEDSYKPRAEVSFLDPRRRRWVRDGSGILQRVTKNPKWETLSGTEHERQIGGVTLNNPMVVALAFLGGLRDEDSPDVAALEALLAPEAEGWRSIDWAELREAFRRYQPTSMVDYPAPYIARVKLSGDPSLEGKVVAGYGHMQLKDWRFLTLTYVPERGWRVFGVGASVPPEAILFPDGAFPQDG